MGDKYIPKIIVWDEICTVSLDNLRLFFDWLVTKNTAVVMCGDHGQPPPFVGPSPHEWLKRSVDYYEEITDDHRALDSTLREFKNLIRLQPNKIQCEVMRNIISETSLNDFWDTWRPNDLIVASRKIVRDTLQQKLYILHKEKFAELPVPLCYRPADTRRQNILVDIPGQTEKRNLVLNDIVLVDVNVVDSALSEWTLGYAMTIHSSQGLTISDTVVWIVDDHIAWSNLVYLAVSRVRKISQLRRIVVGESETSGNVDNDIVKKN
jgi:ATP-dependent exoDNAse (exonuclease V) alpha subunit